jgi:hypothetical protein
MGLTTRQGQKTTICAQELYLVLGVESVTVVFVEWLVVSQPLLSEHAMYESTLGPHRHNVAIWYLYSMTGTSICSAFGSVGSIPQRQQLKSLVQDCYASPFLQVGMT